MLEFKPTEIQHIKHLRNTYFYDIEYSQELFLECMINKSLYYKIYNNSHEIGYVIINQEGIILEFYLITEALIRKEEIFDRIITNMSVSKIYCKSFDHLLLTCAHTFGRSSRIISTVFRDYLKGTNIDYENQFKVRLANKSDLQTLMAYSESGLYDSPEELRYSVFNNTLYLFEKNGVLIGCGYLVKILPEKNYYDIKVWANPEFRKQGYSTIIISYLKRYCFSHSYIPVCGCSVENVASRKALEKNGFISKHCIIEFSIQNRL